MSVAEMSPRQRLAALGRADVAGLLEPFLASIAGRLDSGRAGLVLDQLAQWEGALGEVVETAPARLTGVEPLPWYESARRRFRAAEAYRAGALAGLHAAIMAGSDARVSRWRWAGRSYARAIQAFLASAETRVELAWRKALLARDAAGKAVGRYPVLRAALESHREVLAAPESESVLRSLNAVDRGLDLMVEIRRREAEREAVREKYREVLRRARDGGVDPEELTRVEQTERMQRRLSLLEHLVARDADQHAGHRLLELVQASRESLDHLDTLLQG